MEPRAASAYARLALAQRRLRSLVRHLGRDPGERDRQVHRLGHIVVGALPERLDHIFALIFGGDHDDRQFRRALPLANAAQGLQAVHLGHHHVEQDQVKRLTFDQFERSLRSFGESDRIALELQAATQHVSVHLFVIHQQ